MQTLNNTENCSKWKNTRLSWQGFLRCGKNKMFLTADSHIHRWRMQYETKNATSAGCCVICCCIRQETKVSHWNPKTLDKIYQIGITYYKRSLRSLCLAAGSYIGIESLISTFFIGDFKYAIELEEVSRENESEDKYFKSCLQEALSTTESYIVTVGKKCYSIWSADGTYLYIPAMELPACLLKYASENHLIDDFFMNILGSIKKKKKFSIVKLNIVHKARLERYPKYNIELKYIKQHCDEMSQLVTDKKNTTGFKDACSRITENLQFQPAKNNHRDNDSLMTWDKLNAKHKNPDNDFKSFTRVDDRDGLVLIGTSHLNSERFRQSLRSQGMHVAFNALKMLECKKAKHWDAYTVDDCLAQGHNDYLAYCSTALVHGQRPTVSNILDQSSAPVTQNADMYQQCRAHSIGWGRINDIANLLDDLFDLGDKGILQIPQKLEIAVWREESHYFLFQSSSHLKKNEEEETSPARLICMPTQDRLQEYLKHSLNQELVSADFIVYKVDFLDENHDAPSGLSDSEWVVCGAQVPYRRNRADAQCGMPSAISIVTLVFEHSTPAYTWTTEHLEKIVKCGERLQQKTLCMQKHDFNKCILVSLRSILSRFSISNEEFAETQIFQVGMGYLFNHKKSRGACSLVEGITNFFKEYRHGVISVRGKKFAIWKSSDENIYCMDCGHDWIEDPDMKYCVGHFANESSLANQIEEDLLPSFKNRFVINAVIIDLIKLLPDNKTFPINVQNNLSWIMEDELAILYGRKCLTPGNKERLPAAILFSCACRLIPPMRFTTHHLDCIADATPKFSKSLYTELLSGDSDNLDNVLLKRKVNLGVHVFTIEMEQAVIVELEKRGKDEKIDLSKVHNVAKLEKALRKAFVKNRVQSLLLSFGDVESAAIWRASPFGPMAVFLCLPYQKKTSKDQNESTVHFPNTGESDESRKEMRNGCDTNCLLLFSTLQQLATNLFVTLSERHNFSEIHISALRITMHLPCQSIIFQYGLTNIFAQDDDYEENEKLIGKHYRKIARGVWALTGTAMSSFINDETDEALAGLVSQHFKQSTLWTQHCLNGMANLTRNMNITYSPCNDAFFCGDKRMEGKIVGNQIIGDNKATSDNMDVLSISKGLNTFFGKSGWSYGLLKSRGHTFGIWKLDLADNPNNTHDRKLQELENDQNSVSEITNSNESCILHIMIKESEKNVTEEKTKEQKCDRENIIDEYYTHIGSDVDLIEKIDDDEKKSKANIDIDSASKRKINKNKKAKGKKKLGNKRKGTGKKKKGNNKNKGGKGKKKKGLVGRKKGKKGKRGKSKKTAEEKTVTAEQEIISDVEEDLNAEADDLAEVKNSTSAIETVTDTIGTVFDNFDGNNCLIFLWDPRGISFGKSTETSRVPVVVCFDSTKKFEEFFVKTIDKIGVGSHRFIISGVQLIDKIENDLPADIGTVSEKEDTHSNRQANKRKERKKIQALSAVYEKRLTKAYVYPGGGKAILWPTTTTRRLRLTCLQLSSAWCVAILIMTRIMQIDVLLWDSETMDDASAIALEIRNGSIERQGTECKNILMPEQVVKDISIGKICIHFDLQLLMTADVRDQNSVSEFQIILEQSVSRDSSLTLMWSSTYGCSVAFSSKSKNVYFLAVRFPSACIFSYSSPENLVIGYSSIAELYSKSPCEIILYNMNLALCQRNN